MLRESCCATARRSPIVAELFDELEQRCLNLFAFGQKLAAERGLILVDTKYELGRRPDGRVVLIDEIHTPDSSRYSALACKTTRA